MHVLGLGLKFNPILEKRGGVCGIKMGDVQKILDKYRRAVLLNRFLIEVSMDINIKLNMKKAKKVKSSSKN